MKGTLQPPALEVKQMLEKSSTNRHHRREKTRAQKSPGIRGYRGEGCAHQRAEHQARQASGIRGGESILARWHRFRLPVWSGACKTVLYAIKGGDVKPSAGWTVPAVASTVSRHAAALGAIHAVSVCATHFRVLVGRTPLPSHHGIGYSSLVTPHAQHPGHGRRHSPMRYLARTSRTSLISSE